MSKKTGIIILLILIILFVVVAVAGFSKDDNESAGDTPGWIDFLGDRLTIKKNLDKKDIGTTFPSEYKQQILDGLINLPPGEKCTFYIRKSSSLFPAVRLLTLHLEEGPGVRVDLKQKDRLTVKEILNANEPEKEFSIYDDGGAVIISTENTGSSPVQLKFDLAD